MSLHLDGNLVLPDRIFPGRITFDSHIRAIDPIAQPRNRYILPGFVDGHVHGGDGADTMDGAEAIRKLSRFHMTRGTTTILPTTITAPWHDVMNALHAVAEVRNTGFEKGPRLHGAHLEGPFVSPHKLGAQPPFAIAPTPDKVAEAISTGCIRVVTLAPELDYAETAMHQFVKAGVRVNLGHTTTDYEGAERAICIVCAAGGTAGATHLFNAMSPIEGRNPGPVTALMCSDVAYAEIIFDMHHIHPASFRLASRLMDSRLIFVTDAMRGTGGPGGHSRLGGQDVVISNGTVRLPGGSLAGSILTLDQALRNAIQAGQSLPDVAKLVSTNAARYLGLHDRGVLAPNRLADFTVLNDSLFVSEVWVNGQRTV